MTQIKTINNAVVPKNLILVHHSDNTSQQKSKQYFTQKIKSIFAGGLRYITSIRNKSSGPKEKYFDQILEFV